MRVVFDTVFKNVPYSDREWERANKGRKEYRQMMEHSSKTFASSKRFLEKHPEFFRELKTRPNTPYVWGPCFTSENEARKACEKALDEGAQHVYYFGYNSSGIREVWICGRNKIWKKKR